MNIYAGNGRKLTPWLSSTQRHYNTSEHLGAIPIKQETQQQDVLDSGDPVWICGWITGFHCQTPRLRAAEFMTRFPLWKEWVIPAYNKNRVAVWCVFICVWVCLKVSVGRIGSGCRERGWRKRRVEKSEGVINQGRAQRALCARVASGSHTLFLTLTNTHTHFPQPAVTASPGEPSILRLPSVSGVSSYK